MEAHVLPNLPQEIVCKIIELVGEESFYNLGPFLRARKHGYALAHEPSVLKKCDVNEMEDGFVKYAKVVSSGSFISNVSVLATERQSTMKVSLQHRA